MPHIKETSLDPHCLDDLNPTNDEITMFSVVADSVFIIGCSALTALLIILIGQLFEA